MALVLKDRVRETSTTTGTGILTLAGAVAGFQSFSAIGTGNTTYYTIVASTDWEVGIGTWTSPNQLSRNTVLASTNAGALVNFGAGSKDVFLTFPAEGFASPPAIGNVTPNSIRGSTLTSEGNIIALGEIKTNANISTIPKIIINGTPGGLESLTIFPDNYFTGIRFHATGYYGAVFDTPITLTESTGVEGVTLQASATTTSYNLNLPDTGGSANNVLQTDGSGQLSWMDLASPPAIGGTTPAAVTGTTVSSTNLFTLTGVNTFPVFKMDTYDGGDGYDYMRIYGDDGSGPDPAYAYGVYFPGGLSSGKSFTSAGLTSTSFDSIYGGALELRSPDNSGYTRLYASFTNAIGVEFYLPDNVGSNNKVLKTDGSGNLSWTYTQIGNAPVTITGATYTVAATDSWLIANRAGTVTLTLPTASSFTGRILTVKTITANTVVSASSNVVPLAGGAAGTAILAATAGKWAKLVSDGTNWIIMEGA